MDIQLVQNVVSLVVFLTLSIEDIFKKEISALVLYFYLATGIILGIIQGHIWEMVIASVPGLMLLLVGFISSEKIGYGDGLSILALGVWIGIWHSAIAIALGMLLAALIALGYILVCKLKRRMIDSHTRIPFIPFLYIGLVVSVVGL